MLILIAIQFALCRIKNVRCITEVRGKRMRDQLKNKGWGVPLRPAFCGGLTAGTSRNGIFIGVSIRRRGKEKGNKNYMGNVKNS